MQRETACPVSLQRALSGTTVVSSSVYNAQCVTRAITKSSPWSRAAACAFGHTPAQADHQHDTKNDPQRYVHGPVIHLRRAARREVDGPADHPDRRHQQRGEPVHYDGRAGVRPCAAAGSLAMDRDMQNLWCSGATVGGHFRVSLPAQRSNHPEGTRRARTSRAADCFAGSQ